LRGQRVQGWLQACRITGVQHPGMPNQLSGGRLDRLDGLFRRLWHWPSDPHSPCHHATGVWRRRLPGRVRVADLQCPTLPHPVCRQRLVGVVGLLQDVWRWRANADPHRDGGGGAWWYRVPGFVAVPELQHAIVPRQLCGQWLGHVVGLLQDMWRWSAIFHAHCGGGGGLWRCAVPGPDARTGLQHSAVRRQLRRQCLVRLVGLRQDVRHGYPTPDAHRPGGSGPRRRGVPRVDANTELQHPEVPGQLRRQCVVGLVGLLSLVWRWSPNVAAHRDGGSGIRRGCLPSVGATTGLQHAKLPHQLRGGRVVVVVVLQQGVRWRCADSVAVRVDLHGVRWLGVPGLDTDAGVQHAGVPRQLRCGRVVRLVDLFQDVRRRCPIAVARYHDATSVRRIAVSGPDSDAGVQHAKLPHQLRRRWLVGVVGVH